MKRALSALWSILTDAAMYRGILAEAGLVLAITAACALACLLLPLFMKSR